MKKARRNESGKKVASRAGARAIVWLLLPILVFVLLNADYMPHVPHLTGTSVTEAAEYFRQSTHKVPSSGIEDTIWQQQERLLHDVAKFRAEHDSVVEAPPSRESSHEMAGKLVGANRGTESAIWQQQRQLLREVAELRAAHKELLLEVAKLRAAHDLAVRALPSPASKDETPGKAIDAPPSPPSSDETTGEAVDAPPSPPSSDETPDEAVHAQPSPASSHETPGEAVEALPSPTSSEETPGKANDAPPSPASNDETSVGVVDAQPSPPSSDETPGEVVEAPPSPTSSDETPVVDAKTDVAALRSKSTCDFSSKRMDICTMEGDVRVHGKAATVYVVSASDDSYRPENGMVTIHPYPRKSETETMQTIREVTIRWNDPPGPEAARCTVTHDVPAVVFSTGGYLSNFFHAMTDGIIPLFNTVREYNGRVQLVVTDYNHEWIDKFRDILAALSNYPVIDFDADDEVRCFPSVHVGTESHKELGIIPAFSRKGYTMTNFQDFLRSVYSLKREWSTPVNRASGDRPRLAMILRRNSRAFANEAEAITAAMEVGFEVVSAGPEAVSDTARFAEVVNSCDVMVGVHGAGLANLVFLPRNATVLQVVPWGDLRWASFNAIGAPTADMGLRYVEYEATADETTLKYVYPRDHAVFTDIPSINRQGYRMTWEIFLNGQNITLDIDRFRGVLQQIYQNTVMADPSPASSDETPGGGGVALPPPDQMPSEVVDANRDLKNEEKGLQAMNGGVDGTLVKQDVAASRSKSSCDFRSERMDICAIEGDVRMHGKAATVYVVSASDDSYRPESGTVMIHPYTRKWEAQTMQIIREVTIRWIDPRGPDAPGCTVTHDVPAVVFSTGGYLTNFFHGMTDGIIPLFNTAREYNGRVQLVATDYDPRWIAKFQGILSAFSVYPVLDFDADDEVRCFPSVHVGTESHKELGIIPALSRKGYTMTDFREFLRSAFSLKREWSTPVNRASGERPRLVMVLRRRSRELANEAEAIAAATEVGFEVVPAGPEVVSDMAQFAEVVNSCDVIMGVHGAGLTNLVFLPRNGTVMQIVPWGDMRWASFSAFGAPTADMGLRYVEYEATAEETTLKYVYPRDHAVFTDPRSIQKQGFGVAWWTFFNGQNVTLDINRFRGVLQQIYRDSVLADPSFDPAPVVEAVPSPASSDVVDANRALENEKGFQAMNGGADGSLIKSDVVAPRSKSSCDFRSGRMDICTMDGDVRMHGKAATVYVVSASGDSYRPENGMVTIHPYTRKWEPQTMQLVREVTIRWSDPPGPDAPGCTVTHDVPAVVFSSGGYLANFFHAMTDGIIPLFNTAREFDGRVQLVATNYDSKWLAKFKDILAALSIYPVIDFDADDEVRCFPSVHVGTESHKELGIIPALSRKGYTMTDFRDFLRSAYSLKREWVTPVNITSGDRPRLVMVSRRRSREIANEAEAIATATQVGFEVVSAGPEVVSDMARFAEVVNSCEVILGVHGAGLTNLVFLPRNGTVMQIVPWGDMRWASFSAFGAPTADMGLRYVEYEATAEETTLKYIYPRDHAVFTDPRSIQRQGFGAAWETFFNGQNVTLDINRFRGVLQQIYHDSVLADPSFDPSPVVEAVPSPALSDVVDANRALENEKGFQAMNGGADGSLVKSDVVAPRSKSSCDFRSERMDICTMDGDVRMHGKAATVYVVSASGDSYRPENGMVTIHPYTRKWEPQTMQLIREVTIRWSDPSGPDAPGCTVTHDVPAVVFSSGGYLANFFHAMTDGIIPLFNTAREFDGRVQLVATNYDSKWLAKFKDILAALSIYPVIDFDADNEVRCFPSVRVGTESHKELGIIPALSHKGYTMTDFRDFLRSAYSLKREWATPVNITSGERPRLVMVSRRRSREIANEVEAIATATQVGFEVMSAGPEVVSDMARFAEVVNSCQVILGVHGAGLTNLVFLPRNGTVMQIVPWGDMRWASFSAFGAPTADMGLRYVEYEATAEETTLKYIYPRDHAVFTDPRSIHRLGFGAAWETFFNGQNVTLDIDRFRGVMQQIYQSVTIT